MGISRRTLYGYELEMAKASVPTAYKLEWVLGMPVARPVDIFQYPEKTEGFFATAKRMISENRFLQFVIRKLLQFDFSVFQILHAPFDFVAKHPDMKTSLLVAATQEKEQHFEVRTKEIMSVSKIIDAQPIFIADSEKISNDNIHLIYREELEKIECPEDLMVKL